MSSDIQVGDKVRLVLEDTVTSVGRKGRVYFNLDVEGEADWEVGYRDSDPGVVSIEVIEKAIVTFKPGDVVRSKVVPRFLYTVGEGGYLSHSEGYRWYGDPADPFTSDYYELVTLHESPL